MSWSRPGSVAFPVTVSDALRAAALRILTWRAAKYTALDSQMDYSWSLIVGLERIVLHSFCLGFFVNDSQRSPREAENRNSPRREEASPPREGGSPKAKSPSPRRSPGRDRSPSPRRSRLITDSMFLIGLQAYLLIIIFDY